MKSYAPTTASRRHMTGINYRDVLTRKEPEKSLVHGFKRHVGRNNAGRITVRHKGTGHKRLYRVVSFSYDKKDIPAKVVSVEYDPNRTSFIALVAYADGEKRYVLAGHEMGVEKSVIQSEKADPKPGNALPIGKLVPGTFVYNIELKPGGGGKLVRSGGSSAEVLAQEGEHTTIKLPSREVRKVSSRSWATVGSLSNEEHVFVTIGKAGRSRWLGIRPTVRGSAMNPVDHPYGGGEGRQMRGTRRPKNLWGRGTRGVKTRDKKKYSRRFIISRRKK
ncbi:MAG: 50S ribosomal protein L2 [Candidatus Ryanbacteria bacterium RIFCSPHIGHO2_12_FULL_47_12b]|uniref:Large ribosomal subunit protein uL2 n=2 Tax=Candidatus Ryaniibacteriota TaxID=1817914 RepID=A0A1G2H3F7_9BACT|nr:MAG: 50S ribosomal protein L2 [Candidatus Ryanbacteria bacterium RIFCSPHIGHO2_01_FULL_48_80]OGZ48285.1 MAG: 50S ribosomal protein L2 [Candidatus Ryanbacteria bacterium RIFCSPHIGHO2_02_FULL_47_25]OGZ52207.1 MAG: 50S ribosomal protein L2 [Candidatus Ryanbacteria bacterium RIFCSPLOWO2_01_FULL_47_79]OGZ52875.1 MAG: 50S ribosomal protein L2 [Candidatus Ryanbacteria bacterium RIFCSPHIGHO2_12_FULL_47_12b]OGZ56797.1 MAG: 50S ribosomal protein L2 [Candidatus Ryanbacteria bacterium RIFCSPLOWO2_02_FULL